MGKIMRTAGIAAIALTLAAGASCSWIIMESPADPYSPATEPRCTASKGTVYLDLLIALVQAGVSGRAAKEGDDALAVGAGLDSLIFLVSSLTGEVWASECQKHRELRDAFVSGGKDRQGQPIPGGVAHPPGKFRERTIEVENGAVRKWQYAVAAEPRIEFEVSYLDRNGEVEPNSVQVIVFFESKRSIVPDADEIVLTAPSGERVVLAAKWKGGNVPATGRIRERVTAPASIRDLVRSTGDGAVEVMIHGESFLIEGNAGDSLQEFVERMAAPAPEAEPEPRGPARPSQTSSTQPASLSSMSP